MYSWRKKAAIISSLVLILLIFSFPLYSGRLGFDSDKLVEDSKELVNDYGGVGLFFAMIIQAIISPIPSEGVLTLAGTVLPITDVVIYGTLGSSIGAAVCFYLARMGGRPVVESAVPKKILRLSDRFFDRLGAAGVLVGRMIPFLPFDGISYIYGLSMISFKTFMIYTMIGLIPRTYIYARLGKLILENSTLGLSIFTILFVFFLLIMRYTSLDDDR